MISVSFYNRKTHRPHRSGISFLFLFFELTIYNKISSSFAQNGLVIGEDLGKLGFLNIDLVRFVAILKVGEEAFSICSMSQLYSFSTIFSEDCSWFASNVLLQNSYIQHRTKISLMVRFISTLCIQVICLSSCDVFKSIAQVASAEQTISQDELEGVASAPCKYGYFSVPSEFGEWFLGNAAIKIVVPSERVIDKTRNIPVVNNAVARAMENFESMNRAAEDAGEAKEVFKEVIQNITFQDVVQILNGEDNAATQFLRTMLVNPHDRFYPIVDNSMSKNVDQAWSRVTGLYNQHVGGEIETDLNAYITNKALDGLFYLIAEEEAKIRKDPMHRVTEILQKVFGN